jgi:hypothetical protein
MWNLSIVYHPQTDRLTERKNQLIKQLLRLVSSNQDNWSNVLPLTTLIHNNMANAMTGTVPNQLLIRREPTTTPHQATGTDNPLVEQQVCQLREQQILVTQALNWAAHSHQPKVARWAKGQKVWLDAKNLALPYGLIKLAPRCHGPFKITKVLSPITYQLCLPPQWTIHPTFHTSLLMPYIETNQYRENFSRPPPDLIDDQEQYKVEAIRDHRH